MSNSKNPYMGIIRFMTIPFVVFMMIGTLIAILLAVIGIFNVIGIGEALTEEIKTMHWITSIVFTIILIWMFEKAVKGCWEIYYDNRYPRIYVSWSFIFLFCRYCLGFFLCMWGLLMNINSSFGETVFGKTLALVVAIIGTAVLFIINKQRKCRY